VSVCAFDHPILGGLLGDREIAEALSVEAELEAMLRFEAALARAQAEAGLIPIAAADAIAETCAGFRPDLGRLAAGTARDGVLVPELVRQLRAAIGEPHAAHLHKGATSQDLIDTALLVRLRRALAVLDRRLGNLIDRLGALENLWGARRLMGRTRMRRAEPVSWAHKLASWREPLVRHRERLGELRPRLLRLQLGGAVGDRAALGPNARAIAAAVADALELERAERATHSERDGFGELAGWLALVAGSLGKLGQDVALLAQDEVAELVVEGGGSSAMPHKVNPVPAEVLVALARYAASLAAAVHQAMVHENERSGAAWTLEWLALPPLLATAGAATLRAHDLLDRLRLPEAGR
jgi:3-carboxy-cis,cis-muconate cycloisomerase